MNIPKVSVIVLIYKVEKYIERCARSLFCQTMQDIEYVFVNDCTPDCSIQILQSVINEYPQRKSDIKIISHEKNMGSGVARNTGLEVADGEYIIYCDGDDWVDPDMYEKLYIKAREDNADIVMCDYYEEKQGKRIRCSQNPFRHKGDVVEQMLIGKLHSCVWGALVRKGLYEDNHIQFPVEVSMWEDLCTSVRLHCFAHRVSYVEEAFYHYVQYNVGSLVHTVSLRSVNDRIYVCDVMMDFFEKQELYKKYIVPINCVMLRAKMDFIFCDSLRDFNQWRKVFPVSNKFIWKVPFPFRVKLVLKAVEKRNDYLALIYIDLKSRCLSLRNGRVINNEK